MDRKDYTLFRRVMLSIWAVAMPHLTFPTHTVRQPLPSHLRGGVGVGL